MTSVLSRLSARRAAYRNCCLPLLGAALLIAGCGVSTNVSSASVARATATATLAPTATPEYVPTVPGILSSEQFACPQTVAGSDKTIVESALLLSVAYPSAWTETHCTRTRLSDGSATLWIGNYVHVTAIPDTTMTLQQWVDAHKTKYETVTLQPITVRQAKESAIVDDQLDQSAPSPFDYYFSQIRVLLRGSRYLYELSTSLDVEYQDTSADTVIPGPLQNYVADWSVA
jgi:hypothetical protein